ncbi:MAG: TolC family protein [Bacteroidales bacterium]|nr:TolC family protein [Bacteroidales bacterium]
MNKSALIIILLSLLYIPGIRSQEKPLVWDLKSCIDYALEQNIQVKKSKITLEENKIDTKTAKAQLFPSLSASISQNYVNYPSSDAMADLKNSYAGNYGISTTWTLFNGGKRLHTIKQQQLQDKAQEFNIEEAEDNIEIAITQTYMEILYAYESVQINQYTLEVSETQRDRARELYKAGAISQSDYAQMDAQCSTDKYQLVTAQANLDGKKLELKQLLELDITEEMDVVIPDLKEDNILTPLPDKQTIYQTSLNVMPQIKSSLLSIDIAKLEEKRSKAGYYPTLSFNAGIGTGNLSGTNYLFGTQLWNKFNENIGITMSIPIYSNRENKSAVQKARLQIQDSQLEYINTQKELLKTVENIYLDATSSQSQYIAAKERVSAVETSYRLVEEQFFLGMKNTLELLTEKNNLLTAKQEMLQSKYMTILSVQLLNFYQNKPIVIE